MSREPLQNMDEPSAVSRRIPLTEEDLGPGNTETEAPESMRNSRPERISCTNRTTEPDSENVKENGSESENVWTEVS